MELTFLGTGTSQGVPVITCDCKVCQSEDLRDKRLRTSVMISHEGQNVVIDSGPDFRQQMLRERVQRLDGLVFTHEHKDHIAGMDDIRAFNFKQKGDIEVYASEPVQQALQREFHYVFAPVRYPGVPEVHLNAIGDEAFEVAGIPFLPLRVMHYKMPVHAFRMGDLAYVTDANYIPPETFEQLRGVRYLILNALRKETHLSHFNLEQALDIVEELAPEKAWLTHLSHQMGLHSEVQAELPEGVFLAYDGLQISW